MKNTPYLMLPLAALAVSVLSGCSNLGALVGQNQPALSPAAKAAAEMPLEKDPVVNTQETYLALVRQMQSKSLWYASIAHLDALDKQWGASSDSRLLRADALRQVGQLNAAVPIYQGLLGSGQDGAARYGLGRVAAELGDFPRAAQQMEQARAANPVDSRLLTDLGYAYLRARDLNAARLPLMQAAQLNPEDAQANVNLSLFMMVSGQGAQAEEFMRQRKLDAQTQQAVKEQANQWLQGAKQAAAEPAPQAATGKVVNLSRPEAEPPQAAVVKAAAPAPAAVPAAVTESVQEVPPAKKPVPEPERAQTPVLAAAQPQAAVPASPVQPAPTPVMASVQPMAPQSVERAPSGGQWMVSGSSFDSARPRHPGQFTSSVPQTYAYAAPAPVQIAPAAPASVAVAVAEPAAVVAVARQVSVMPSPKVDAELNMPVAQKQSTPVAPASVAKVMPPPAAVVAVPAVPQVAEPKLAPPASKAIAVTQEPQRVTAPVQVVPVQRAEPALPPVQQPVVPRQPTGPARSLQEGAVVMAAASPAPTATSVRQVGSVGHKQTVQAMLPRNASAGGLFFETPDEAASKPVPAAKANTPERMWP